MTTPNGERPECDACTRRAMWRIRPNCACELRPLGGQRRHWYYACTKDIGTVTRIFTEHHRTPHVGERAVGVVLSELPR